MDKFLDIYYILEFNNQNINNLKSFIIINEEWFYEEKYRIGYSYC